jgi:hypothetical protein
VWQLAAVTFLTRLMLSTVEKPTFFALRLIQNTPAL